MDQRNPSVKQKILLTAGLKLIYPLQEMVPYSTDSEVHTILKKPEYTLALFVLKSI